MPSRTSIEFVVELVDRNSLSQRRGRTPDKSTAKRRFHAISVTMRCCNTNVWRHCDSLATRLLRGVVSSDFPALGGVRVAGESGKVPCDSHGDFSCRVFHTCFSALCRVVSMRRVQVSRGHCLDHRGGSSCYDHRWSSAPR